MSDVFLDYSKYYDLLYKDKDYESEVNFIYELIQNYTPKAKSVLNLGCGTGNHDFLLSNKGLDITGVDLSKTMIEIAQQKNNQNNCTFIHGDARELKMDQQFDVVISLFHVFSYQNSNQDAESFLKTIANYLKPDGIAIFDYWYGPAVLKIRPENRIKKIESADLYIERNASTDLDEQKNIATVNFDILIKDKTKGIENHLSEKHPMRYFFSDEIKDFISTSKLKFIRESSWMNATPPTSDSWAAFSVVRK